MYRVLDYKLWCKNIIAYFIYNNFSLHIIITRMKAKSDRWPAVVYKLIFFGYRSSSFLSQLEQDYFYINQKSLNATLICWP